MSASEGGIIRPSVAAPASVPMIMCSGYWRARSSGMDILPTVVSVAADDPETAANTVQPTMLVCTSPPGSRASQGERPRNMSCDRRVR